MNEITHQRVILKLLYILFPHPDIHFLKKRVTTSYLFVPPSTVQWRAQTSLRAYAVNKVTVGMILKDSNSESIFHDKETT